MSSKYWNNKCNDAVNYQISLEFKASYHYHYLFSYFDNDSIGLKNIAKFFNKCSLEERDHAHKFIEYQNKRGGCVNLFNIEAPNINLSKENDVLDAFSIAYQLEEEVYNNLLKLHRIADEVNDPQFADFIESEYLEEQIQAMNEIRILISQLERIGNDGHGVWNFDNSFEVE